MMRNPLENNAKHAINEQGPKLRQQLGPLTETSTTEVHGMADYSQYGESTPVIKTNQELPDTWQPIGGAK